MKRVFILVIDALGAGAMPDAASFGDAPGANTLGNLARAVGGLHLPWLGALGLGNILSVEGVPPVKQPLASWGRMAERSIGKDTTTGHWEIAGLVLERPFETFPGGFPKEITSAFLERTSCGGLLGNVPASGTAIIEQFHAEHKRTGFPIVYTSADSVFQIAADEAIVPAEQLYGWCRAAREVLDEMTSVSRVIARPYRIGPEGRPERIAAGRHDYAVPPPGPTLLDAVRAAGGRVTGIGKIGDIFNERGLTHSIPTKGNRDGLQVARSAVEGWMAAVLPAGAPEGRAGYPGELVFINLVDTDSLFGHRRDPVGYRQALEEIDLALSSIMPQLVKGDLFIITADHGCDPTAPGTDHTREYVPLLVYAPGQAPQPLGTLPSFTWVADTARAWLNSIPSL